MKRMWFTAATVAAIITVALVGRVIAQPTSSLPIITVTASVTTGAALQIVGANPSRRAIQICAFSNSAIVAPVNPPGVPVVTPSATVGVNIPVNTCFSSLVQSGGVSAAWQAIGNSGTASVSVLEY